MYILKIQSMGLYPMNSDSIVTAMHTGPGAMVLDLGLFPKFKDSQVQIQHDQAALGK